MTPTLETYIRDCLLFSVDKQGNLVEIVDHERLINVFIDFIDLVDKETERTRKRLNELEEKLTGVMYAAYQIIKQESNEQEYQYRNQKWKASRPSRSHCIQRKARSRTVKSWNCQTPPWSR